MAKTSDLALFASHLLRSLYCLYLCFVQLTGWEGMNKPYLQLNLYDIQLLGYSCTLCGYATFIGESNQRADCVASSQAAAQFSAACCMVSDTKIGRACMGVRLQGATV